MKHLLLAVITLGVLASCGSTGSITGGDIPRASGKQPVFDPAKITKEEKERVRVGANQFVGELNRIIQRRDFTAWEKYLEPKYKERLESKENLAQASQSERLRQRQIVLQNLFDYFINVVVPSRSDLRVDDIDFISQNRVKAYMIESERRVRIYELERFGDSWRIVN